MMNTKNKNSKNNRKQLSAAARKEKNAVERLRRFLEKNLTEAKKNGWKLSSGMWFSERSACLFGLAIVNRDGAKVGSGSSLAREYMLKEDEQAAAAAGVPQEVVSDVIYGFDEYEPLDFDDWDSSLESKKDFAANYHETYRNMDPFARLGWRLAKKHLGKSA